MAKDSKFGTFGGVFTPSILTILGVIMYLRLPWVAGHAGLATTLAIVVVAHVISLATGLSISSIATDKSVGAGGPYYIVSRSLGLPIGGALGLALFIGLALSISLYVIGFSESFLSVFGIERTPTAIRIVGTATLVLLTAVTIASTALAIKTQYLILGMIGLSLVAIFFGNTTAEGVSATTVAQATAAKTAAATPSPGRADLFAIFFPAVTGFTAGVNMSGDLRDPKSAIPIGTMAAIIVGMGVYVGLVVFLTTRVPSEQLIADPNVLSTISWNPSWNPFGAFGLVSLGVWGATLSSGLGSILGAPRILQALSNDGVTPRILGRGTGPTKEPRNALVVAFVLAEAGILIAQLDIIARVVSMVFLTMYGFLNLSCALEAAASPDFRPSFRIPVAVSVIGAVTCVVVMIQLDLGAMIAASSLMIGLFVWLQRRQLQLDSGDAWAGIWSSLVRLGLHRLTSDFRLEHRNWRPNILAFHQEGSASVPDFSNTLVAKTGLVTLFEIAPPSKSGSRVTAPPPGTPSGRPSGTPPDGNAPPPPGATPAPGRRKKKKRKEKQRTGEAERQVGVFRRQLATGDSPFHDIRTVVDHFGFTGLEPNTLLLDWQLRDADPVGFAEDIDAATARDFNVVCHNLRPDSRLSGESPEDAPKRRKGGDRIDVWWQADAGNIAFSLALLRFLTRAQRWEHSSMRFLLFSADSSNNDNLRTALRRVLRDVRIEADVSIVGSSFDERSYADHILNESADAGLIVLGLPNQPGALDEERHDDLTRIAAGVRETLFLRGNSAFGEVLPTGRDAAVSQLPPLPEDGSGPAELPELDLPESTELAVATTEFSEAYQRITGRFTEHCLQKVYGRHIELIRAITKAVKRHLTDDKAYASDNLKRQRNAFNRQQSSLILECQTRLEEFGASELDDLRGILEGGIDAFLHDDKVVVADNFDILVQRSREELAPADGDTRRIRRFKRRRRFGAALFRRQPRYRLPLTRLRHYYFGRAQSELLQPSLQALVAETHQLVVQLGRLLNSSRAQLLADSGDKNPGQLVEAQRRELLEHLDDLDSQGKQRLARRRWALIVGSLELSQDYAQDLQRFDFRRYYRKERAPKLPPPQEFSDAAASWFEYQKLLLKRSRLALTLSNAHHRLTTIVQREADALRLGLSTSALRECKSALAILCELDATIDQGHREARRVEFNVDVKNQFDPRPVLEALGRDCNASVTELPASIQTLTDDSIQALEEGRTDGVETVDLPLRRLAQFLVESEIIGGLDSRLAEIPRVEQHALGVAADAARLIHFQFSEFDASESVDEDDFRAQMHPIIKSGIERVEAAISSLEELGPQLSEFIDERLRRVLDASHPFELTRASARLEQHIRVEQGKRAVSGVRGLVRRARLGLRRNLVRLVYQKSQGVLLAHQRREALASGEQTVDRVATLVRSELPRSEVVDALPFYYRQLYLGQSGLNDTFWVDRKEQITKARQALKTFDAGRNGALFVVGDRLAGKTALIQRLTSDTLDRRRVLRVHPPAGGTIDRGAFDRALAKARHAESQRQPSSDRGRQTVIVMDDLELWWERSPDGLAVIEEVLRLIDSPSSRTLFVFGVGTQAYRMLSRVAGLSERALAVLTCGPLSAENLQTTLTLRHKSTGMHLRLDSRDEDELGPIALARYFSALFDYTGGSVGSALRSWVAGITRFKGETVELSSPSRQDWEALDGFDSARTALLLELLLHKQISIPRLARVVGRSESELLDALAVLRRTGVVTETQKRVVEIHPGLHHVVHDRLSKRGLLA